MSRSFGGSVVTSRPPIRMRPDVGSSSPATIRSVVDFPQPLGPTSTRNSPGFTSNVKSSTAGFCPFA